MLSTTLRSVRRAALTTTACALAIAFIATPSSAQLSRGKTPKFAFESPLVNGQGAKSLEDMQGKLVWVEFWGTY